MRRVANAYAHKYDLDGSEIAGENWHSDRVKKSQFEDSDEETKYVGTLLLQTYLEKYIEDIFGKETKYVWYAAIANLSRKILDIEEITKSHEKIIYLEKY